MSEQIKSGIYIITNTITGDCYIGSSSNIPNRFLQHRRLLSTGRHHAKKLQHAWDNYGEEAFDFRVLEYIDDIQILATKEQEHFNNLHPKYNTSSIAVNQSGRYSWRDRIAAIEDSLKNMRMAMDVARPLIEAGILAPGANFEEALALEAKGLTRIDELLYSFKETSPLMELLHWAIFGITREEHAHLKSLPSTQMLDNYMTIDELRFYQKGLDICVILHRQRNSFTVDDVVDDILSTGEIVKDEIQQYEASSGRNVVTKDIPIPVPPST